MRYSNQLCTFAIFLSLVSALVADAATIALKRGEVDPTFYPGGYAGVSDNSIFYFSAASGANAPSVWMSTLR